MTDLQFDWIIFGYALYVGFAYSFLAFGVVYFRYIIEELQVKEFRFGEDITTAYNPLAVVALACFFFFFCIFALLALAREPSILLYTIPIACAVNMVQIAWRANYQRLMIKTGGFIVRTMLKERCIGVRYDELHDFTAVPYGSWYYVQCIGADAESPIRFHVGTAKFNRLLAMVTANSGCRVSVKHT